MKKCVKRASPLGTVVLIAVMGCANSASEPVSPRFHPLEQNAMNALGRSNVEDANQALKVALDRYQSLDDLAGQWRITRLLAHLALASDDTVAAARHAGELHFLSEFLDEAMVGYDTHLTLGRVSGDDEEFERALGHARTPLETAVARTYLRDNDDAVQLLEPSATDHAGDRAFVYYSHGVSANDKSSFERALAYYRLAEDPRGIADTLLRLAQYAESENRYAEARALARRASTVLTASGDDDRAATVERWLMELAN